MYCCSPSERALKERFGQAYARSINPVMQAIERQVCGCDFGGNSWTSRAQADAQIKLLGLEHHTALIDLGSGTGWPGIYMAKQSECSVTLLDLPEIALQIAAQRAADEGLSDRVVTCVGDAADLPFDAESFDAISHSDLLCCLVRKRAVLAECRRTIRPTGRMVFTVISITTGLSPAAHHRALEFGPPFVELEDPYPSLLHETEWNIVEQTDLTAAYADSCRRQIDADQSYQNELADLLGHQEAAERLDRWRAKLAAVHDGLFVRELFVCEPATRSDERRRGMTVS